MNTNQYTQKTLEALQAAQQLAVEYQHNAMEPEHLLHALATQEQGLIPQLLQKLNVDAGSFSAAVAEKLSAMQKETRELGISENVDPFVTLSFMALTVIPEIRVTERGVYLF